MIDRDKLLNFLTDRLLTSNTPTVLDLTADLLAKTSNLLEILDDREVNHGSLIGPETLNAKNELRLELSRWK